MDRIVPLRRFIGWALERLLFLGLAGGVLYVIHQVDRLTGLSGTKSVNFSFRDFATVDLPLSLLITYILWFLFIVVFDPPCRLLTRTEVFRRRGGRANALLKGLRALVKFLLHLTLIGFFVDAAVLCLDRRERRSIPDRLAGTRVVPRRGR